MILPLIYTHARLAFSLYQAVLAQTTSMYFSSHLTPVSTHPFPTNSTKDRPLSDHFPILFSLLPISIDQPSPTQLLTAAS